ncbi:MAG: hypothetical protein Q8P41_19925 [Pseudomonadota bacterium]|nr:hypothetical protein [Pseudomonadota bacterium]
MVLLAAFLACVPAPPAVVGPVAVPIIDELAYLEQIKLRRPDLFEHDCWNTLTLKPRYREALLAGADDYAAIEAREYAAADRATDLGWMASHQEALVSFCQEHPGAGGCARICAPGLVDGACGACPDGGLPETSGTFLGVRPAGYPLCSSVGYLVGAGTGGTAYDPRGVVQSWKVFFEFQDDFATTLTPAAYLEFSQRLAAAGYRGDSKIRSTPHDPGKARFQYNNIVVHGHTPADARIAETVGLAVFGVALAGHGRGLDVGFAPDLRDVRDWHHFLCEGDLGVLSAEALAFVRFDDTFVPPAVKRVVADESPVAVTPAWTPLARYESARIGVLEILWHPDFDSRPELRARVDAALREDLASLARRVTPEAVQRLAGTRIAVAPTSPAIPGLPSRGRGIGRHRSAAWVVDHGGDAAREGVIEVYNAEDYLDARTRSPDVLLGHLVTGR